MNTELKKGDLVVTRVFIAQVKQGLLDWNKGLLA
jgi:hypothetical protein